MVHPIGEARMEKVTGICGIFFKAKEPKVLGQWYAQHRAGRAQPA